MSYRIAQDFSYVGRDYWHWWAWIEAEPDALARVRRVDWILHPTFKVQRITSTDRAQAFRLETSGWGTFLLRADVVLENGELVHLRHNLRLEYPEKQEKGAQLLGTSADGTAVAAGPRGAGAPSRSEKKDTSARPLTVYLSYGAQDARLAGKVKGYLEKSGVHWLDSTSVKTGAPVNETIERLISSADAVVGIVGDDDVSPWVISELKTGIASGKRSFTLLPSGTSSEGLPSSVEARHIVKNDAASLATELISGLKGFV